MAELPWFKFSPSEWMSGEIYLTSPETQGIFLGICCIYWKYGCDITMAKLERCLSVDKARLKPALAELFEREIIECIGNELFIKFLDEQNTEFRERHRKLSDAGRRGGQAKAGLKPPSSIGEGESEEETESEGEGDRSANLHAIDFFKNKNCYVPQDEEYWFVGSYKRFSDDFLNLCIKRCSKERARQELKPRVCRSDLTIALTDEFKKYGDNALRNPPTQEEQ